MIRTLLVATLASLSVAAPPSLAERRPNQLEGQPLKCLTKYHRGTGSVEPLPTETITRVRTVSRTVTDTVSEQEKTFYVTPDAVTITTCVTANASQIASTGYGTGLTTSRPANQTIVTSTSWVNVTNTFITGYTTTFETCTGTTTVQGDGTTTVYTGTYNGTLAKRTASPMDTIDAQPEKRDTQQRVVNDANWAEGKVAYEVRCLVRVKEHVLDTTTTTIAPTTTTLTKGTPTVTVTSTETPAPASATASSLKTTTITSTTTTQLRTGGVFTSEAECTSTDNAAATSTTTQHAKCAPTNLIAGINNHAILGVMAVNVTQSLTGMVDASDCCQTCADNDDCVAMQASPAAGNCFLYLTKGDTCPALTYTAKTDGTVPGEKTIRLAEGCGMLVPEVNVALRVMQVFEV